MGAYVNYGWLVENGEKVDRITASTHEDFTEKMPVIVIDNQTFLACGIAFNPEELEVFLDPRDKRRKEYWICNVEDLLEASDLRCYLT